MIGRGDRPSQRESPLSHWQALLRSREPIDLDVPILVRKLPDHSGPSKLVVEVLDTDRRRLGSAAVFRGGWYPGGPPRDYSHYFAVLHGAFAGVEAQGHEPILRLQLLKAVNGQAHLGRDKPYPVLLKFVVAPEFAITGTRAEQVYQCPMSGFYRHFLNVGHDVLRDPSSPAFVAGQAIHRGYARAAREYLLSGDERAAVDAYLEAVIDTWSELFPYLLLDRPHGVGAPKQMYRLPLEAADTVIGRCRQLYQGREGPLRLLQERLFFSPTRGISGKADRIVEDAEGRELWELKTHTSSWAVDKDPRTGRAAPGGIQALAYHEILRTLDGTPPRTFVELLDPKHIEGVPLAAHPVVTRAEADVAACDDRYVDLVAQARNVAYVVASGLLTGYDRDKLARLAKQGQKLRIVGGDFDLYGSSPPCSFCPAGQRGLCEATRSPSASPWFDFFRHVPDLLFEYWAWFHGQLKQGENADRERLFHLVSTPPDRLERDQGICVTDLAVADRAARRATLVRRRRIETRLREDDRVLVTPMDRAPGEVHSVEATVRGIGAHELQLELNEPLPAGPATYRVDQLGYWDRGDWQLEGLTDFLIGCLHGGEARGRRLEVHELPRLARIILGVEPPDRPTSVAAPSAVALTPALSQGERGHLPPLPLGEGWGEGYSRGEYAQEAEHYLQPRHAQEAEHYLQPRHAQDAERSSGPAHAQDATPDDLNLSQLHAIDAVLALQSGGMLLIQGPPGTGKTTMVAHLVRRLARRDFWRDRSEPRPVLLLANTHRACNEVVLKLHHRFPDLRPYLVRLGPAGAGMEPEVRQHVLSERLGVGEALRGVDAVHQGPETLVGLIRRGNALHDEALIFVGTLAGAGRPELRGLEFSTIIVDETGQATEPAALQALRHTVRGYQSRLILVGDHQQLPPVVPDDIKVPSPPLTLAAMLEDQPSELSGSTGHPPLAIGAPPTPPPPAGPALPTPGLRRSLFERLATRHPDRVLTLAAQYRMCGPISELVSQTFYDGRLVPGHPRVAAHRLSRFLDSIGAHLPTEPFAARVLDPARPIALIDTSLDPRARDTVAHLARDETRDNPREAELIAELIADLLGAAAGPAAAAVARQIGVISPYRKQNNRIRQELAARAGPAADAVRVDTVDRFQGGECELVFLSLVASNPSASIGELHADRRRMNVAISRAKAKLVILGDRRTFTAPSTPEEEPAKIRYRRMFSLIDAQVAQDRALIVEPPS